VIARSCADAPQTSARLATPAIRRFILFSLISNREHYNIHRIAERHALNLKAAGAN
jgi:hypothetical protein